VRFVSFTTVDIKTPNQERIVRDKEQGLGLNDEVGRNGMLLNLGAGTLIVKISDSVNKTSKEVTLPPMWQIDFIDDHVSQLNIATDIDGTQYYLTIDGRTDER
jgi:hypothetical protein